MVTLVEPPTVTLAGAANGHTRWSRQWSRQGCSGDTGGAANGPANGPANSLASGSSPWRVLRFVDGLDVGPVSVRFCSLDLKVP